MTMLRTVPVLGLALLLSACSVVMATQSREGSNLTAVNQGASRGEVERVLGAPIETTDTSEGRWYTYRYVKAKRASAGRAIAHGALDVVTLGLWEIAGTPIEIISDDKHGRIRVLYDDESDRVIRVRKLG